MADKQAAVSAKRLFHCTDAAATASTDAWCAGPAPIAGLSAWKPLDGMIGAPAHGRCCSSATTKYRHL
jgi:hypothetical protein